MRIIRSLIQQIIICISNLHLASKKCQKYDICSSSCGFAWIGDVFQMCHEMSATRNNAWSHQSSSEREAYDEQSEMWWWRLWQWWRWWAFDGRWKMWSNRTAKEWKNCDDFTAITMDKNVFASAFSSRKKWWRRRHRPMIISLNFVFIFPIDFCCLTIFETVFVSIFSLRLKVEEPFARCLSPFWVSKSLLIFDSKSFNHTHTRAHTLCGKFKWFSAAIATTKIGNKIIASASITASTVGVLDQEIK